MRKTVSWAWWGALAGALGASGALALVACSSGDDNSGTDAGKDSGKADTGSGGDSGGNPDTGNMDSGNAVECGTLALHPDPDAGPYCPFQAGGDGGVFANCGIGQHCCEYSVDSGLPSTCNGGSTACNSAINNGGYDWHCDEPNDCADAGTTCCIEGNVIVPDKLCPATTAFVTGVTGSACKTSCVMTDAGGEVQMCQSQSDCTGGKTCLTFKKVGKNLGVCL